MTNIRLFHPGIMEDAIRIRTTSAFSEDTPVSNLTNGERFTRARLATTSSWIQTIDFELPSGTSQSADFFYLAAANALQSTVGTISFRGSSASYFTGEGIGSITAWYDTAHQYYKNTSTVMSWIDRSSNSRNLVQTNDSRRYSYIPEIYAGANGLPVFRSVDAEMIAESSIKMRDLINAGYSTTWTLIKTGSDVSTFQTIWWDIGGYIYLYIESEQIKFAAWDGSARTVQTSISPEEFYLIRTRHNNSNIYISKNTQSETSTACSTNTVTSYDFALGRNPVPFIGDVCEVIFSNQDVGSAQTPIDYYLMAKWINQDDPYVDNYFTDSGLRGPRTADYVATFSEAGPFRYWWAIYNPTGLSDLYHSKAWGGLAFDMGKEADYEIERIQPDEVDYTYDSGARRIERTTRPIYRIALTWTGVTDAKVTSFQDIIARYPDNTTFALTTPDSTDFTAPLDGQRCIHCRLISAECQKIGGVDDYNIVRAEFEELIG